MTLPPGYEERSAPGVIGFAWGPAAGWLGTVLGEGSSLHDWAASRDDSRPLVGRGTVYAVDAPAAGPDQRGRWAVRRYQRGGLMASLLYDRYLRGGPTRPVRELAATAEARARGVRAPAVVAGAVYVTGPFYRADLVTELIPNARTLEALLFQGGGTPDATPILRKAGQLVGELETAAVLHADLNAANILLIRGDADASATVVDLDRCRVLAAGSRPTARRMRGRLERSLRKLGARYGRPIRDAEWESLRAAYEEGA